MAEIRVDQSHCNLYTANGLAEDGWQVLFQDPGRVSRGGAGFQGNALRVFESAGLPIPDIIAINGNCLLSLEIDTSITKVLPSLASYRDSETYLLTQIGEVALLAEGRPLEKMLVGFCRTGTVRDPGGFFARTLRNYRDAVDLLVAFEGPRKPRYLWPTSPFGK